MAEPKNTKITEVIGFDIEQRHVDQVGNRLDRTGGWCVVHDDFGWIYSDDSVGCFRQAIVHDPDTSGCHVITLAQLFGGNTDD